MGPSRPFVCSPLLLLFRETVYGLEARNITNRVFCPLLLFHVPLGSVLGVDVVAPEPLPPFPASIMDGYAVVSSDGPGVLEVRGGIGVMFVTFARLHAVTTRCRRRRCGGCCCCCCCCCCCFCRCCCSSNISTALALARPPPKPTIVASHHPVRSLASQSNTDEMRYAASHRPFSVASAPIEQTSPHALCDRYANTIAPWVYLEEDGRYGSNEQHCIPC